MAAWTVLDFQFSKVVRVEGAGHRVEACASPGVCGWLRAPSAKLLPDWNENAEIRGPSTAGKKWEHQLTLNLLGLPTVGCN